MGGLAADGVQIFENVVPPAMVAALIRELPEQVAGARHLLQQVPAVRALADSPPLRALLETLRSPDARPVRAVFFDKNPAHNWKVPWHQDLTIAVRERREVPGFGPWSVKEGVAHVQPPAALLARMVTLRVHLDDCAEDNGPLRVRPGSHLHGRLSDDAIAALTGSPEITCCVRAGGVVALRPLLLHASSPARVPCHRRVIHLEFSPDLLPDGLEWFEAAATV